MRPGLRAELRSLSTIDVNTSYMLLSYISNFAPYNLRYETDCVLTEEEMKDVPIDDQMTRGILQTPIIQWITRTQMKNMILRQLYKSKTLDRLFMRTNYRMITRIKSVYP